jgi:hypothetical protein
VKGGNGRTYFAQAAVEGFRPVFGPPIFLIFAGLTSGSRARALVSLLVVFSAIAFKLLLLTTTL